MKHYFLLLTIVLIFIACNDSSTNNSAVPPAMEKPVTGVQSLSPQVRAVLAEPSMEAMKQAYGKLTEADKGSLWKQKFATILQNDKDGLTEAQHHAIVALQQYLTNGMMQKMKTDKKIADSLEKRISALQAAFTPKQLAFLAECPYFSDTFSIVRIEQNKQLPL